MPSREPGTQLARSAQSLVSEAMRRIHTIPLEEALTLMDDPGVLFVDIRDPRELNREGTIPHAFHAPRGMLEFWIDPESPYYKPKLDCGKRLVLFCGGAWRSALAAATLTDMGVTDVAHIEGGFSAWKEARYPVESP